jgi:hypothetical protein
VNHVRIATDGTPPNTHIFIDGVELTNVTHVAFEIGVDEPMIATVTARMFVNELDVQGSAVVDRVHRQAAKLADIEAIERVLLMLGTSGAQRVIEFAIGLLAERAK